MATLFLRDRSSDNPSDAARLVPRLAFFGQLPQIRVMIVELVAWMRKTPATPQARSQALSFACHLRFTFLPVQWAQAMACFSPTPANGKGLKKHSLSQLC